MNRETIEKAARELAGEIGLVNLTRAELCRRVDILEGSFQHFVGMPFVQFVRTIWADESLEAGEVTVARAGAFPALRKESILDAAVSASALHGYALITRTQVAEAAGVSPALVTRYFVSMPCLRDYIMREAVRRELLSVVAQGLATGHPLAVEAPQELKDRAAETLKK